MNSLKRLQANIPIKLKNDIEVSIFYIFKILGQKLWHATITEPDPEKILCSGNCGFTIPTIYYDTFRGSINRVLTKVLT